jgi:hypothetical protein
MISLFIVLLISMHTRTAAKVTPNPFSLYHSLPTPRSPHSECLTLLW